MPVSEKTGSANTETSGSALEENPTRRAQKWSSPKVRAWAGTGAVALVIASLAVYWYYSGRVSTDDAQVDGHIAPVAAKVAGNVEEILVDDNQVVKAGQLLFRLDSRDYEAKVAQAEAALSLAENQASAAEMGVPLVDKSSASQAAAAEAQVKAAEAELVRAKTAHERISGAELAYARAQQESAKAAEDRAKSDLGRMEPLAKKQEISGIQYDGYVAAARIAEGQAKAAREKVSSTLCDAETAQAALKAAEAKVWQAKAQLEQARAGRKQLNIQESQAKSASAAVEQARANLKAAQLQLSYTKVAAPIDGVVTKKRLEVGQVIQPSQGVMALVPLDQVWVTANFKETQLANVQSGQRAEVEVDMYGHKITGKVESIAGATGTRLSLLPPENATGNYVKVVQRIPVKIVLDKEDLARQKMTIRPGMNVDATILLR